MHGPAVEETWSTITASRIVLDTSSASIPQRGGSSQLTDRILPTNPIGHHSFGKDSKRFNSPSNFLEGIPIHPYARSIPALVERAFYLMTTSNGVTCLITRRSLQPTPSMHSFDSFLGLLTTVPTGYAVMSSVGYGFSISNNLPCP